MKYIFISGCYATDSVEQLRSNCKGNVGIQNASNAFQWSIIKGLNECGADFEVVSFPWLPVFPVRFRIPFSPRYSIMYKGETVGEMCPYCTIMGLKPVSIKRRLRSKVEQILASRPQDEMTTLLVYSTSSFYLDVLIPLSKRYPNVQIVAIVTDLIDDAFNYKSNNTFLKRIQIKKEAKAQKASYHSIDKFILLTKAMEERIPEAIGRDMVLEGICDRAMDVSLPYKPETNIKTVLYTGTLQKYVGIDDFIEAFVHTTNPNYRLIICGAGPSEENVRRAMNEDFRIQYLGVVPREKALELQQHATILVNPRKPTESITRFSFPSKIIEYLSSGTPMIGYQLEGIPTDYYPFFYCPKGQTVEDMTDLLDEVLSKPSSELEEKALLAKRFIIENKSASIQVGKIIQFVNHG